MLLDAPTGKFDFSHKLFTYVDTNNTKRLVEWMFANKDTIHNDYMTYDQKMLKYDKFMHG